MKPGVGERYETRVTWEGGGVPSCPHRNQLRLPSLAPSVGIVGGSHPHPQPPGQAATPNSFTPKPAAAKPPGTPGKGGCWVSASPPTTPFLPVSFFISLEASLLFPTSLSTHREPHSQVYLLTRRGAPTPLSPLLSQGSLHTCLLTFLYTADAFISIDFPFLTSGVVPITPGSP